MVEAECARCNEKFIVARIHLKGTYPGPDGLAAIRALDKEKYGQKE